MLELFTNAKKTKKEKVDISAPAFSVTKIGSGVAVLIAALLAALPTTVKENTTILVASIASATLIMLAVLALVAVDIKTRQRAHEAKLRFGGGGDGGSEAAAPSFQALPTKKLILQQGHSTDEYEVQLATVEKDLVQVIATRDGDSISATFKETPKPK